MEKRTATEAAGDAAVGAPARRGHAALRGIRRRRRGQRRRGGWGGGRGNVASPLRGVPGRRWAVSSEERLAVRWSPAAAKRLPSCAMARFESSDARDLRRSAARAAALPSRRQASLRASDATHACVRKRYLLRAYSPSANPFRQRATIHSFSPASGSRRTSPVSPSLAYCLTTPAVGSYLCVRDGGK